MKCHIVKKGDFPGVSQAIWAKKCNSLCELMLSFSLSLSCLFQSFFFSQKLSPSEGQTIKDGKLREAARAAGYAAPIP